LAGVTIPFFRRGSSICLSCREWFLFELIYGSDDQTLMPVYESRKWKEAVARETKGVCREERLAYFSPEAVRRRFQEALRHA